jgi:import inner membrane translocase subunit TIM16
MHVDEALNILDIPKSDLTKLILSTKYKSAYDRNDPDKGGSFYLRSKIYRANLTLEEELNPKNIDDDGEDEDDSSNDSDKEKNKENSKKS